MEISICKATNVYNPIGNIMHIYCLLNAMNFLKTVQIKYFKLRCKHSKLMLNGYDLGSKDLIYLMIFILLTIWSICQHLGGWNKIICDRIYVLLIIIRLVENLLCLILLLCLFYNSLLFSIMRILSYWEVSIKMMQ